MSSRQRVFNFSLELLEGEVLSMSSGLQRIIMTVDGFSSSVDGELARYFIGFIDILEGSESSSDNFVSDCKGNENVT